MILREVRQKEAEENLESRAGGLETNLSSCALKEKRKLSSKFFGFISLGGGE